MGFNCSSCKSGWAGTDCNVADIGDLVSSTILTNTNHSVRLLTEILNNVPASNKKLLFRASRDGFASSSFHTKCDNKGPTIVLIKAKGGAVFGSYARFSWASSWTNGFALDTSSFLFSLISSTNQERFVKFPLIGSVSINYNSAYGPIFGGGHDLLIVDNSNQNSNSYANLCYSYCNNDATMIPGSITAQSFMAGSAYFQVDDYEVYSLQ